MIINGDSLEILKGFEDNSIHCCITSPPYFGLRKYGTPPIIWGGEPTCEHDWTMVHPPGHRGSDTKPGKMQHEGNKNRENLTSDTCIKCGAWKGELGLEPSPEMYVSHLVEIFHEVRRVLREDGTCWLNIGDSYASGKGSCFNPGGNENTLNKGCKESGGIPTMRPNTSDVYAWGMKPKDMIGVPWMLAFALRADGWWIRADLPWIKRNSMPSSVTDRPASSIEHVFLLAKSGDTTFWTHPSKSGTRTQPGPDYVYTNIATGEMTQEQPENWAQNWKRRNLWKGRDYFYDYVGVLQKSSDSYNNGKRPRGVIRQKVNKNTKYDRDDPQFKKQDNVGNNTYTGFNDRYAERVAATGSLPTRNLRDSDLFFRTWQGLLHNEDGEPMALVVNPRGYKGAHFACFPLTLIEPMIVASTSEKGCCPSCGAPWVRLINRDPYICRPTTGSGNQKTDQSPEASGGLAGTGGHVVVDYETVGWNPSCGCYGEAVDAKNEADIKVYLVEHPEEEPVWKMLSEKVAIPCKVLDPFGGSGATGAAAKNLGRDSVIIELKSEYCDLAEERVKTGK